MRQHDPASRPGRTGVGTPGQDTSHGPLGGTVPAVVGAVVRLGDPELVAAELIERVGSDGARCVAAWVLLLAEEVEQ